MELNLGISGAKRTSYNEYNLRDLLLKVRAEHPECDDIDQLRDFLIVEVKKSGNEGYRDTCYEYACSRTVLNTFTVEEIKKLRSEREQVHQKKTLEVKTKLKEHIRREAIILLDLKMANGKVLGDCTKADLKKVSGWSSRLAEKLTGRQTVKEVFSEKQVRGVFRAA